MTKTVGILLAGGLSSRFGSPKAFAKIDGTLFYERAYRALEAACDQVVVVTRDELRARFPDEMDVIIDLPILSGKGPLAGIGSAMSLRPADRYMVLPCDMPFIGPEETIRLKNIAKGTVDVTAVKADQQIPLFSVWNGNWAEALTESIKAGNLGVFRFLEKMEVEWVESARIHPDNKIFKNINTNTL